MEGSYLDIKLKRLDRVYRPKEKVEGNVIVHAFKGWSHSGINLVVEGLIYLSHSNRGFAGIGGDPNNRPIHLLRQEIQVCGAGKFPDGVAELPFSFVVNPVSGQQLYESYHGVYVSIVYNIQATCDRGVMKKSLIKDTEFLVEIPMQVDKKESEPVSFSITPEALSNVNSKAASTIPKFSVSGKLHRTKFPINQPLTGEVLIELSAAPVKSLELQLVRVETVSTDGRLTKEATEVQNIQIGDGNICRNFSVPMYMVFPRIFSCPTLITPTFKIEFEVNLIMIYGDDYMITENFPIVLFRDTTSILN
ncbi:hypothetical protein EON65_35530 [archaeon]|nr:MAG: hypothetical protein EON65_35530 [archaeon]